MEETAQSLWGAEKASDSDTVALRDLAQPRLHKKALWDYKGSMQWQLWGSISGGGTGSPFLCPRVLAQYVHLAVVLSNTRW